MGGKMRKKHRPSRMLLALIEPACTRSVFDQNALAPDSALKAYDQARIGARRLARDAMTTADPPEVVAEAVFRTASATHPRRRYTAGKVAWQVRALQRFAPASSAEASGEPSRIRSRAGFASSPNS